jgi:hypothetical protein
MVAGTMATGRTPTPRCGAARRRVYRVRMMKSVYFPVSPLTG